MMRLQSSNTLSLLSLALLSLSTTNATTECALNKPSTAPVQGLVFYDPDVPFRHQLNPEEALSDPSSALRLYGTLFGNDCLPMAGATVEVWYAGPPDATGNHYLDEYRGKLVTDECGGYEFTQTFPVKYIGSPHVNLRVSNSDQEVLVTQVYFEESLAQGFAPDPSMVAAVWNEADGSRSSEFDIYLDLPGTSAANAGVCDIEIVLDNGSITEDTNASETITNTTIPPVVNIAPETSPPTTTSPVPVVSGNINCGLASTALPVTVIGGREPLGVTPVTVQGSNEGGDLFSVGRCFGVDSSSPTVWYRVQGTGGRMIASTCHPGTDLDTKLTIYQGTSCDSLQCVTANDDSSTSRISCPYNSLASRTEWDSVIGATYYIVVHAFSQRVGGYELSVESHHTNDQCDYAAPLAVGDTFTASTVDADIPFENNIARCQNDGGVVGSNAGLWYSITGTGNRMEASTCSEGTKIPNKLYLFEETCVDSEEVRYVGDDDWEPDRQRYLQGGQNNHNGVNIRPDPLDFLEHCIGGVHNANGSPDTCVTYQWDSVARQQYYVLVTSSIYEGDIAVTLREI